jgi:hypothetical protein
VRRTILIALFGMCVLSPTAAHAQWYPYPPLFPYRHYPFDDLRSAVRVEVAPKDAEVYVDGYYAGIVDDFDGAFQRLRLPPGHHEIVVRKDGFHAIKEDVYLTPDTTFHIRRPLEPLPPGAPIEPRPTPLIPPGTGQQAQQPGDYPPTPMRPAPPAPGARRPPSPRIPPAQPVERDPAPRDSAPRDASNFGALVIRVQPDEAEIVIDGERWRGPQGEERLLVQLPEGPHRVEIQKDGFVKFSGDVQLRRGETTPLNVSLARRD